MKDKLIKIIKSAEKQKFGRKADDKWAKRLFIHGALFAIKQLPEGIDALNDCGYSPEHI